jgi:glucokinase
MMMLTENETRWIVLGTDGRHVSLGRTEPSEAEITAAGDALAAQGLSAWLARIQGDYYSRRRVTLEPLQRIGAAQEPDWQAALTAFHTVRGHITWFNNRPSTH